MPTTVTKKIGTGGDYTTIQAWEDACPANLVAVDQIWRGELKNQEFTVSGPAVTFDGVTTDATRYIELTVEAGASFVDNPGVQSNPLRYNAANGAAINAGTGYANAMEIAAGTRHIYLSRFQIKHGGVQSAINSEATGGFVRISQVIAESAANSLSATIQLRSSGSYAANSLLVARGAGFGFRSGSDASIYNCTLASTNGSGVQAIRSGYSNPTVRNCAMFGFAGVHTGGSPVFSNCFTDAASPPSGCTTTAYSTSTGAQFQNITDGTHDFRIKTGSVLRNAGATDASFGTPSINGLSRPQGASFDVGAWEVFEASVSDLTGNVQLDDAAPTGTLASLGPSSLTGSVQLADAAPTGTLGAQFSSVRTLPASRNPGNGGRLTSIAGVALAVLSDDANLSRLAGTSSLDMGIDGRLYYANGIPVPIGTSVAVVTRLPGANGALGIERYVTIA